MRLYKLTDQKSCTYNSTQWGEGITHKTSGKGALCTSGWLHAYTDPYLAILLDPIHACFGDHSLLWLAEGRGRLKDDDYGLKIGVTKLTTIKQLSKPKVSLDQRITFAIYCALAVYGNDVFKTWANNWLDGSDRSKEAAKAAAKAAARAATKEVAKVARVAANIAARAAAWTTAWAAANTDTWTAANIASYAAEAAETAAKSHNNLDLISLAHKACGGVEQQEVRE